MGTMVCVAYVRCTDQLPVDYSSFSYALNTFYVLLQIGFNAYVHFRVASGRNVFPNWLFALAVIDLVAITSRRPFSNKGFASPYFVLYYPVLAWVWLLSSFRSGSISCG